ncbi:hypothetical protein F0250_22050 [Vibrio cyclitrophicus]|uniref:hypothetical protein n=1 Tax=Vibrio cyclitrophicus TaxID=47951 RepID=UPI00148D60E2|nr:hypothetical protein [Vibrio cyclitrophicus]NOI36576.1 hypothetical protein [Vibrio cyclitrophicus]
MNEIEYLNWLIVDTAKKHPELSWFLECVADSLGEIHIEYVHYCYANESTDWDVLMYCAYQSIPLNVEHTTTFITEVFIELSNAQTRAILH